MKFKLYVKSVFAILATIMLLSCAHESDKLIDYDFSFKLISDSTYIINEAFPLTVEIKNVDRKNNNKINIEVDAVSSTVNSTRTGDIQIKSGTGDVCLYVTPRTAINDTLCITMSNNVVEKSTTYIIDKSKFYGYIVSQNTEGGTVSGHEGLHQYGEVITLTATPNEGYAFNGWYVNDQVVSSDLNYIFVYEGFCNVSAKFEKKKYTVEVVTVGKGIVRGAGEYEYGTNVELTAIAENNYILEGFYEDDKLISSSEIYSFLIKENRRLKAIFNTVEYRVAVNATEGGTATGDGLYKYGSTVTVTATEDTGYTFMGWYKGSVEVSKSKSYQFIMNEETVLEAKFNKGKWVLTVVSEEGGTATGGGTYEHGSTVSVTATAGTGYTFSGWYEGSNKASSNATYLFTATETKTLVAKFTKNKYTLTVTADVGGTATGAGVFEYNDRVTVKSTPGAGYSFDGWYEDALFSNIGRNKQSFSSSGRVSADLNYTFSITGNRSLNAKFTKNTYLITATAETGGSVTGAGTYDHGESVTLKATVSTGYTFDGWYSGASKVSDNTTYTFTASSVRTLVARFIANTYVITATADTGGSVTGAGTYDHGTSVTLKATTDADYTFVGWYEGSNRVYENVTYTFTASSSRTLVAKFTKTTYVITATADTGGSVTGAGTYGHGVSVTLRATAEAGYTFVGWHEGSNKVFDNTTYTFTASSARTLVAKFTKNKYTITLVAEDGGTVSGGGVYDHGVSVTLKAVPDAGYTFEGWYSGVSRISANATYTFSATEALSLSARFSKIKYTLTLTAEEGGTVTGAGSYDHNVVVSAKATVSTGYTFAGWYNGSTKVSDNLNYTFSITASTILTAKFTKNKYTITLVAEDGGTVSGGGVYDHGVSVTLKAVPDAGYTFEGWYSGVSRVSANATYTFSATEALSLSARFSKIKYTLTLTAEEGGTVTGEGSYDHNVVVSAKATVSTGYTFAGWYNGSTKVSDNLNYTFSITASTILTAKFTKNKYTIIVTSETGGSVTGAGTYDHGASVILNAVSSTGYSFSGWYEGEIKVSGSTQYTFTATSSRTLVAKFTKITYLITATAETGGSVTGAGTYEHGASVTLKATVNTGYTFVGWYDGSNRISDNVTYTFTATSSRTLVAKFTITTYVISATAETGGNVTGAGTYEHDASLTLKATVNTGYTFVGWYEGSNKVSDNATYTFTATSSRTLVAKFTKITYLITATAETGGSVTGAGTYEHGASVTLKATVNTGYVFDGWYEGSNKVSDNVTYTFTASSVRILVAKFKKETIEFSFYSDCSQGYTGEYEIKINGTIYKLSNSTQLTEMIPCSVSKGESFTFEYRILKGARGGFLFWWSEDWLSSDAIQSNTSVTINTWYSMTFVPQKGFYEFSILTN